MFGEIKSIISLVLGFVEAIKNHLKLKVNTMRAMFKTVFDEELSSILTQLLKAKENVEVVIGHHDVIDRQLVKLRARLSKLIKTKATLETSLRDSSDAIGVMAKVANLKKIMHSLKATKVVRDANFQSLS